MTAQDAAAIPRILTPAMIARHWRHWYLIGLAHVLLGIAAFGLGAALAPETALVLLAAMLAGDALLQLLHGRLLPRQGGSGWRLSAALVSFSAALLLLGAAADGPLGPPLVIQLMLLLAGISKGFLAMMLEPLRGWYWLFVIAMITTSLGLGLLVLPSAPPLLLSSLVGVALLLDGAWTLQTARMARRRSPALLPM